MNISRKAIKTTNAGQYKHKISILTYNILADYHVIPCRNELYHHASDDNLLKTKGVNSKRHLLTMKEIEHFNTDIVLLQEIDDWYSPVLSAEMEKIGYEYSFFSKIGIPEGCAICYKKGRFESMDTMQLFIHDEVHREGHEIGVKEEVINQMAEPHVALIKVLKDKVSGKILICATIHIVCDEFTEPGIQALQGCFVCKKIIEIRQNLSSTMGIDTNDIAVIFGGDFSAEPDHVVTQLMKNGKLSASQVRRLQTLTYIVTDRRAVPMEFYDTCHVSKYFSKYLDNPLKLSSAYFEVMGQEPPITSSEGAYMGTLDYIFHTADLKVASVIDIDNTVNECFENGGPTEQFASDHLPLVAEFVF